MQFTRRFNPRRRTTETSEASNLLGPNVSYRQRIFHQKSRTAPGCSRRTTSRQGHHHSGDEAARRPHILCSICDHSLGALAKAVRLFNQSKPVTPRCRWGTPTDVQCINSEPQWLTQRPLLTFSPTFSRLTPISKGDFSATRFLGQGVGCRG